MTDTPIAIARLKTRADFLHVTRARISAGMPGLVLQAAVWRAATQRHASAGTRARIGFTASRRVGNAVARNRAKRRLRALAEEIMKRHAAPGRDYVLIARSTTPTRPYAALRGDLERAMKRLHVWRAAAPSAPAGERGEAE